MTLENIRNKDDFEKTDRRDKIMIVPNNGFDFKSSTRNYLHNTRLFRGSENAIHLERQLSTKWICDYNLNLYPFDTQCCNMKFRQFEEGIALVPISTKYSGSKILTKHFIEDIAICSFNTSVGSGVAVEITISRPLFGTFLTVYLPTGLLVLLSHMVTKFTKRYLELVIEVNLTLLLVLTTL